jgi:hypothetical protein
MASGQQEQGHWGNSNRTVLQQHWGRGHRTVIAMGQWGTRSINRILIVLQQQWQRRQNVETGQRRRGNGNGAIDRSIAMVMGQEDWGNCNGKPNCSSNGATAMAMGQRSIVFLLKRNKYVLFRGSMSCIVVGENVQNVWTAIICEVVPAIKTGPF